MTSLSSVCLAAVVLLVVHAAPEGLVLQLNGCGNVNGTQLKIKSIPSGYKDYGLGVYRYHKDPLNFGQAWKVCESEGAHLVIINSEEEALLVASIMTKYSKENRQGTALPEFIYVGVHDLFVEGQFTTVEGRSLESTGYLNWAPGEQDGGLNQNCVLMHRDAKYRDEACTLLAPFMCEL